MANIKSGNLNIVEPSNREWTDHTYLISLGAHGWTHLLTWANSLESAQELAIDWAAEHAPGLLADESVREEYERQITAGADEETAMQAAEVDTTSHDGHYLNSWEIRFVEDPSRDQILAARGSV